MDRTRVAAYALIREDGRLLLCRVTPDVAPRQPWTLPGGGLEFGESPEMAAIREVREETGLEVRLNGLAGIDSETFHHADGRMHALRIVYWAERTGGALRDERDGSTDLARFVGPSEARALPLVGLARYGLRLAFPVEIRPLGPADAEAYWKLRLEALEAEPFAFGSSAEDHRAAGFEAITRRHLAPKPEGGFLLGAFRGDALVGMVGLARNDRPKSRHLGGIVSMYVTPAARGRGVARALLEDLIERARAEPDLTRLGLSVTVGMAAAQALYRSLGFVSYGVEPQGIKVGELSADMDHMSLELHPRREGA